MKYKTIGFLITVFLLLAAQINLAGPGQALAMPPAAPDAPGAALGSAFTYQGQLSQDGSLVSGACDFQFSLWDNPNGGSQLGSTLQQDSLPVDQGVFTTLLDFGNAFSGEARWLEIAVRCPSGSGGFSTLSPRQALTPAPYALALPGLQVQPASNSPNLIGGYTHNIILPGAFGAVIAGGGQSGSANQVSSSFGVVSGGLNNLAGGISSVVSGGDGNQAAGDYSALGGGVNNTVGGLESSVSGGVDNSASGDWSSIGGGDSNTTNSPLSIIGGGSGNLASGYAASVGGGFNNTASGDYATIAGGQNITVTGQAGAVGGGFDIVLNGNYATAAGGQHNSVDANYGTVGGGLFNSASDYAVSAGGSSNNALGYLSTASGGNSNYITGYASTISGGEQNTSLGNYANVGGGNLNHTYGDYGTVAGGNGNTVYGYMGTIGGGTANYITGTYSTIAGGRWNRIEADYATISGGGGSNPERNWVTDNGGTVGGGINNFAGSNNGNPADATLATVSGGKDNQASGTAATVPGGQNNIASGDHSFAAGCGAQAVHAGSYVWADSLNCTPFASERENQYRVRAYGGMQINDDVGNWLDFIWSQPIDTSTGAYLSWGGTWTNASDAALKENFASVNPQNVLDKVAALPVQDWNYISEGEAVRHLGPTAQDFYAAFGLGDSDKAISTVDADGVSLAAIQGLYALTQQQAEQIADLQARSDQLEARLQALEQTQGSGQRPLDLAAWLPLAATCLIGAWIEISRRRARPGRPTAQEDAQ